MPRREIGGVLGRGKAHKYSLTPERVYIYTRIMGSPLCVCGSLLGSGKQKEGRREKSRKEGDSTLQDSRKEEALRATRAPAY